MKTVKTKSTFTVGNAGPRFLLFLKNRRRSRWSETPAKTSGVLEAGVLIAFFVALFAIAVLAFHVFHHSVRSN
jgi:hypothetical protein